MAMMCTDPLISYRYMPFIIISITCLMAMYVKCVVHFSIEKDFLDSLPLGQQCTEEEEELLHFLFENKLKKVGGSAFSFENNFLSLLLRN